MPPQEPQNLQPIQPVVPPVVASPSHKGAWAIATVVLFLAIIIGGLYAYMIQSQTNQQVASGDSVAQATSTLLCADPQITHDQLLKMKFSLDILRFWQVDQVFQYPQDPNKFYYILGGGAGESIEMFDASKDKNYLQDEYPSVPTYNEVVYNEKISDGNEFRGVGFDGNKFVFMETSTDDSPGPCYSPWLSSKLSYIDVTASTITRQPYIIPSEKQQQEINNRNICQENL